MYSIWIYLKESTNCSCKQTDVLQPQRICKYREHRPERENCGRILRREKLIRSVSFRRSYTRERFYQLNAGDPSRNVIEMVFQTASTTSSPCSRTIERVFRISNSIETLRKFEEYRDIVKNRAHNNCTRHPRSVVDGNELLRFYNTTITCCSRKLNKVSEPCSNTTCGVCRMIQTGFDMEDTKRTGMQLRAVSEALTTDIDSVAKGGNVKMAVVICRVIAGTVVNMVEGESDEEFDSFGSGDHGSKLDYVCVKNPNAVLPCFVIVCA